MKNRMSMSILLIVCFLFVALPVIAGSERVAPSPQEVNGQAELLMQVENDRHMISNEIIESIRGEAVELGYDASWEDEIFESLQNASAEQLLGAQEAKSYDEVLQVLAGVDSIQPLALGSWTQDLVYKPVQPCRIVDTRNAGGMIPGGSSRPFFSHGDTSTQGGGTCNDPNFDPSAVVLNITAVKPSGTGHFRVYPYNTSIPNASIINFITGTNLANSTIAKITRNAGYDFSIYASTHSHVVVDLMGYFAPPNRTAPDTQIKTGSVSLPLGDRWVLSPPCDTGYSLTGGGCSMSHFDYNLDIQASRPWSGQSWHCAFKNIGSVIHTGYVYGMCTRIPGR